MTDLNDLPCCDKCGNEHCTGHELCHECDGYICGECGGCDCPDTPCPGHIAHQAGID